MSALALMLCAFMVDGNPFQPKGAASWRFSLLIEPEVSALMRVLQPVTVQNLVLEKLGVAPLAKDWRVRLQLSGCDHDAAQVLARRLEQVPCVVSVAVTQAPGTDASEALTGLGEGGEQGG